ncbi:unnamed protein product [Ambrosiozyma monospora]|uniref:Unnamed protein product n=1 Tax=Ambrosiozyma monospora TaxID=43982 RepID=A0ACB5STE6_AMBMO|nr:unnamed protein product [Ambrosiozyma monospora]
MSIESMFDEYKRLLKQIEVISHELRSVEPGTDFDISQLRENDTTRVLDIYDKLDYLNAQIEYTKLSEFDDYLDEHQYEFSRLKERYSDLKVEFRKSQLISKDIEYTAIKENDIEEEELPDNNDNLYVQNRTGFDDKSLKKLSMQEQLLDKNTRVTTKLQNINSLLQSSILTGEMNAQDLSNSSRNLGELSDKYDFFADVLVKTNKLVKTINASSNKERRRIYYALAFFFSVCAWIIFKRVFYKPIRLVLWIFFKLLSFVFGGSSHDTSNPSIHTVLAYATNVKRNTPNPNVSTFTNPVLSVRSPVDHVSTTVLHAAQESLSNTISYVTEQIENYQPPEEVTEYIEYVTETIVETVSTAAQHAYHAAYDAYDEDYYAMMRDEL